MVTAVRKVVIPVAGYGTRMYPASKALKKELFPVVGPDGIAKPVIQHILEEAVESGIEQVCLVAQPGDEAAFRAYFGGALPPALEAKLHQKDWAREQSRRLADLASRLSFVEQTTQDGFGHAVFCARRWVGDEPFMLMLGDHLYTSETDRRCARQLLDVHRRHAGTVLAVEQVPEEQLRLVGTVRGEPLAGEPGVHRIAVFHEKPDPAVARRSLVTPGLPAGRYLGVFGQYVIEPQVFDVLERFIRDDVREGGEIQLTAALECMRQSGRACYACEISGRRHDTGVPAEYVRTIATVARGSGHAPGASGAAVSA